MSVFNFFDCSECVARDARIAELGVQLAEAYSWGREKLEVLARIAALEQLVADQDGLIESVRALLKRGQMYAALSVIDAARPRATM